VRRSSAHAVEFTRSASASAAAYRRWLGPVDGAGGGVPGGDGADGGGLVGGNCLRRRHSVVVGKRVGSARALAARLVGLDVLVARAAAHPARRQALERRCGSGPQTRISGSDRAGARRAGNRRGAHCRSLQPHEVPGEPPTRLTRHSRSRSSPATDACSGRGAGISRPATPLAQIAQTETEPPSAAPDRGCSCSSIGAARRVTAILSCHSPSARTVASDAEFSVTVETGTCPVFHRATDSRPPREPTR
jgi:hypothetical protein